MKAAQITKTLSANDVGATGGHQAGMLIPKDPRILSFFPKLDPTDANPRSHLVFEDEVSQKWTLAFIYYNNRLFGGTRNEYRLTHLTRFIRQNGLVTGDEIVLSRKEDGSLMISIRRASTVAAVESGRLVLKLGSGWKVVNI
ncbi:MAG: EcoRII N-terminal effector-binding domain-containing protein [Rhodanobacter sp.]